VGAAAVSQGLVLDPAAELVEGVIAQPTTWNGSRDLVRVRQRHLER